jgi:hypothetical protein
MFEVLCASFAFHESARMQPDGLEKWSRQPEFPCWREVRRKLLWKSAGIFPTHAHRQTKSFVLFSHPPDMQGLFLFSFFIKNSSDIFIYLQFFILLRRFVAVKSSSGTDKTDY